MNVRQRFRIELARTGQQCQFVLHGQHPCIERGYPGIADRPPRSIPIDYITGRYSFSRWHLTSHLAPSPHLAGEGSKTLPVIACG